MANFNNKIDFNKKANAGGANYNSAGFYILIRLFETMSATENLAEIIAKHILREDINVFDELITTVLINKIELLPVNDKPEVGVLFELMENLGIVDTFSNLLVSLYLTDRISSIDEMRLLSVFINQDENINLDEIVDIKAIIEIAEQNGFKDVAQLFALIEEFESVGATDREPKKAISDFVIGQDDRLDKAFDWLLPFNLLIDWDNTSLQVMPRTESSYIDLPNIDGSIIENTVYKNRLFNIVAWSQDGLSTFEKEQLKYDLAQILDSTKDNTKKLTIHSSGTSFDVKYSGEAEIKEAPSFIKATIPFETSPYGYRLFEQEVLGSGILINGGDTDTSFVNIIKSGCVNPSFKIGNITYNWSGTVPNDTKLVIDHENYTCYLETVKSSRTNVIDKLQGEFQKVPKGASVAITASLTTQDFLVTTMKENVLW